MGDVHKAPKAGKIQGGGGEDAPNKGVRWCKEGRSREQNLQQQEGRARGVAWQSEEVGRGETRRHSRATTNQCRHSATCASTAREGGRATATQGGPRPQEGKKGNGEEERGEERW